MTHLVQPEITLQGLAGEVDVSQQTPSKRLRSGPEAVVQDVLTICGGSGPD